MWDSSSSCIAAFLVVSIYLRGIQSGDPGMQSQLKSAYIKATVPYRFLASCASYIPIIRDPIFIRDGQKGKKYP